jgi:hypothetical protein
MSRSYKGSSAAAAANIYSEKPKIVSIKDLRKQSKKMEEMIRKEDEKQRADAARESERIKRNVKNAVSEQKAALVSPVPVPVPVPARVSSAHVPVPVPVPVPARASPVTVRETLDEKRRRIFIETRKAMEQQLAKEREEIFRMEKEQKELEKQEALERDQETQEAQTRVRGSDDFSPWNVGRPDTSDLLSGGYKYMHSIYFTHCF